MMTGRVLPFDSATHKVVDVLLPWFVNGTLESEELALVQRHLGECQRCRHEVEWLREFHAACTAAAAAPDTAAGMRQLRRHLDRPRTARTLFGRWRLHWMHTQPWAQWALAAQLAVIVGLGAWAVARDERAAAYRTLGTDTAAVAAGSHIIVFAATATEADLRRILRSAGATIVNGPTQANAYVLDVPPARGEAALRALRAEPLVTLIESLGPASAR